MVRLWLDAPVPRGRSRGWYAWAFLGVKKRRKVIWPYEPYHDSRGSMDGRILGSQFSTTFKPFPTVAGLAVRRCMGFCLREAYPGLS